MKSKLFKILGGILILAGLGSIIYAIVIQCILQVRLYGVVLSGKVNIFVPDISAFGFLGIVPIIISPISFLYANHCEERENMFKHD